MGLNNKSGFLLFVLVLCCLLGVEKFVSLADKQNTTIADTENFAVIDNIAQSDTNKVLKNLLTARPDLEFTIVGISAVPGVYEVQVKNGPLLFVHESGEYLFQGDLLQITASEITSTMELRQTEKRRQ